MKKIKFLIGFVFILGGMACTFKKEPSVKNIKDLDENMIDLRMYHELLGDELRAGDMQDARWFLTGMDSILQIVSEKFDTHRKLDEPFRKSFERNVEPALETLEEKLNKNDLTGSKDAYIVLTQKCNGCHKDNDIDKVVQNWLNRGQ
jgi:hypothetical protein